MGAPPRVGLQVLLAEDNPVNQKLAVGLLSRRGHRVTVVGNGREALDALERERYDVVLMDVQMPEMGGLEATQEVRRRERGSGRHTPIVAMTARAMKGDREQCLAAGMDDYIAKPIRAEELLRLLDEIAGDGGGPGDGAEPPEELVSPGEAVPPEEVFDEAGMAAMLGGHRELLRELLTLFLEDGPRLVRTTREALDRGDAAAARAAAHSLKGSAGSLRAQRVARAALRIETSTDAAPPEEMRAACAVLEAEMARLEGVFRDLLNRSDP